MEREKVIEILRKELPYFASEYGVKRIGLFGSYAKGTPIQGSDIDILVEFERPIGFKFIEFTEYLEGLLGTGVDILTPAGIESIRIEKVAKDITESIVYV
ncbi:MAG: nucleotidyltransferase family protein [Planctomycetes bacterium]|nr:nucleotidyltransferase family protein [Planctomycetota bacterium]